MKMDPDLRKIIARYQARAANLRFPVDPTGQTGIVADTFAKIGPQMKLTETDADDDKLIDDCLAAHSEWSIVETTAPHELCAAAFGEKPTLDARAALARHLAKQIGGEGEVAEKAAIAQAEIQLKELAKRWNADLRNLNSGRDPAAPLPGAGKKAADNKTPINPWNPRSHFASEKARDAAKLSFTKMAGPAAAAKMAMPFLKPHEANAYRMGRGF
jgi:hypothetical protein